VDFIQFLYFALAAVVIAGVGFAILLPTLRKGDFSNATSRMMLSFGAKMVLGIGTMALAWKGFGWSSTVSAFGAVGAYLVGLVVLIAVVLNMTKRGNR